MVQTPAMHLIAISAVFLHVASSTGQSSSSSSSTCTPNPQGLNLSSVVQGMRMFPPLGDPNEDPVTVNVNMAVLAVDSIRPGDGVWGVRLQSDMYWDSSECATTRNTAVCADRFSVFYFVTPEDVSNPDGVTQNAVYSATGMFAGDYANGACLTADYLDLSMMFSLNFKPYYYPWEAYQLDIKLTSFWSAEAVKLEVLDKTPSASAFEADMPGGWASENGLVCKTSTKQQATKARGGGSTTLENSQIICSMIVSNFDSSWFLTVFIFWSVTILGNLFMGIGVFGTADSNISLRAALINRGTFTSGAVLAYVFVVPAKPYNLHINSFMPTSTSIFVVGLVMITLSAFYSFGLAIYLSIALRDKSRHRSKLMPLTIHQDMVRDGGDATSTKIAPIPDESEKQKADNEKLRMVSTWTKVATFDLAVWIVLHVLGIVASIWILLSAQAGNAASVASLKAALNAD